MFSLLQAHHLFSFHSYSERLKCSSVALTHTQMVTPLLYCTYGAWYDIYAVTSSINSRNYGVYRQCHFNKVDIIPASKLISEINSFCLRSWV